MKLFLLALLLPLSLPAAPSRIERIQRGISLKSPQKLGGYSFRFIRREREEPCVDETGESIPQCPSLELEVSKAGKKLAWPSGGKSYAFDQMAPCNGDCTDMLPQSLLIQAGPKTFFFLNPRPGFDQGLWKLTLSGKNASAEHLSYGSDQALFDGGGFILAQDHGFTRLDLQGELVLDFDAGKLVRNSADDEGDCKGIRRELEIKKGWLLLNGEALDLEALKEPLSLEGQPEAGRLAARKAMLEAFNTFLRGSPGETFIPGSRDWGHERDLRGAFDHAAEGAWEMEQEADLSLLLRSKAKDPADWVFELKGRAYAAAQPLSKTTLAFLDSARVFRVVQAQAQNLELAEIFTSEHGVCGGLQPVGEMASHQGAPGEGEDTE